MRGKHISGKGRSNMFSSFLIPDPENIEEGNWIIDRGGLGHTGGWKVGEIQEMAEC